MGRNDTGKVLVKLSFSSRDFNEYMGKYNENFEDVHEGNGIRMRNLEEDC